MAQAKHTPGPWKSVEARNMKMTGEVIPVGVDVGEGSVRPLAWVPSLSSETAELRDQANADARLIAAAPEQNSALHNAVEFLHFYFVGPEAKQNRDVEGMANMLAEAKAAFEVGAASLAKATGAQ